MLSSRGMSLLNFPWLKSFVRQNEITIMFSYGIRFTILKNYSIVRQKLWLVSISSKDKDFP